jgi:hypothetical protein
LLECLPHVLIARSLLPMTGTGSTKRVSVRYPVAIFCLVLIGASSMAYYHLGLFIPRVLAERAHHGLGNGYAFGDDFYPVWLTTRRWRSEHRDLYSAEMTREIQTGLFGRPLDPRIKTDPPVDYRQFTYPAFTDLLFWPAALFNFPTLRILLAVLLPVLTVASVAFWLHALDWGIGWFRFALISMLTLCTYELLEAFFALQPGLFCGFFLAAAALALRRNRLSMAGALTALTLIKPQMTLLVTAYLLLWSASDRRRAKFCVGFFAVTITLMAAALWIWPHWVGEWLAIVRGYHRYAMPPLIMVMLGGNLGKYFGPFAITGALGAGIVVGWKNRRADSNSLRFWFTLSLLLIITSVTLLPGQAIYDHVILIPGILLFTRYRSELRNAGRVPRAVLTAGTLVLFWQWMTAFVLVALRPWSPAVSEVAVFTLPLRMATSLPFAVLALVAYSMRIIPMSDPERA